MNVLFPLAIFTGNPVIPVALTVFFLCVVLFVALFWSSSPTKTGPDAKTLLIALLDAMPSAAYWKGPDGRLLGVNLRLDELFPRQASDQKQDSLTLRLPPEEAERLDRMDRAILKSQQTGAVPGEPESLPSPDGQTRQYTVTRLPLLTPSAKPLGLLVLLTPLGQDVGESFELLRPNEVSWLYDRQTRRFIHVGPQFERIWGRSRMPLLKGEERYENSLHPSDRKAATDPSPALPFALADEYRIVRPDNSVRVIRSISAPLADGRDDELRFLAGVEEDVTEDRRMADLLAKAGAPGLAATLGSAVAHEITQPLNAISLRVSSLLYMLEEGRELDEPTLLRYLRDIKSGSDRLANTVEHMRGLIRRDAPPSPQPVDLNRCCEQAVSLLMARAEAHTISLQFRPSPDQPQVLADAKLLEQMVINLVSNALQAHIHNRGYDRMVSVATVQEGDLARLKVEDNGPGIPEADRDRIFEPFVSGEDSSGTGLGLALTRHFARNWGGSARAEPSSLGGAAVIVELPLHSDADTD